MTELLAEFGYDAAEGRVMDAAELREQADTVAEQQAEVLKEKLATERPAPEETLSFYVAECLEFTFAGEFHDHLTMEEALEAYQEQYRYQGLERWEDLSCPDSSGIGRTWAEYPAGRTYPDLVWADMLTWSLELYQQTNARLWRQGQTDAVTIYHIITKDKVIEWS